LDTEGVGQHEVLGSTMDRAVDVRLCREVDHMRDRMALDDGIERVEIGDISLLELVSRVTREIGKVVQVARVGQLVEGDDQVAGRGIEEVTDEVGADEAGTTANE